MHDFSDAVIRTEDLSRDYGIGQTVVHALNHVNLEIRRGEFLSIVGPSGSGKSTLLHLIGVLDQPSSGKIWLAGRELRDMSGTERSDFRRDHIGFIFQSYNLIPVLSAEENIEYVLLLQGVRASERKDRVRAILKEVGLEGYENRRPPELSGGQQQRVAVARAMVSKPALILADEPTANLDSHTGSALLDLMRDLNEKEGMTFVFSTHDPMVMQRARRLITLQDGAIEKDECH